MPPPELAPWPAGLPEEEYTEDGGVWFPPSRAAALDARLESCDALPARAAERIAEQAAQDDAQLQAALESRDAQCETSVARARADAPGIPVFTGVIVGVVIYAVGCITGALAVVFGK